MFDPKSTDQKNYGLLVTYGVRPEKFVLKNNLLLHTSDPKSMAKNAYRIKSWVTNEQQNTTKI